MKNLKKCLESIDKPSQVYVLLIVTAMLNAIYYKQVSFNDTIDSVLVSLLTFLGIALSSVISEEMKEKKNR